MLSVTVHLTVQQQPSHLVQKLLQSRHHLTKEQLELLQACSCIWRNCCHLAPDVLC